MHSLRSHNMNTFPAISVVAMLIATMGLFLTGCEKTGPVEHQTMTITDQLGRRVEIPRHLQHISAMHHFGGKIVYALGQQHKLVEQALYGKEALAMARVDTYFAGLPRTLDGHAINIEYLIALKPQCAFVYASFDKGEMAQLENAGIKVVAVRGETLAESYEAVKLMAKVLDCEDKGQAYLNDCQGIVRLVQERIKDIPADKRLKVMLTGPKSVYTLATGQMLQTEVLELSGGINIAKTLKGFWADISPEQVATWNPDVIFLGSNLATYGVDEIYRNPQFKTIKAVKTKRIYTFPSPIGWWDYPAPNCVLGILWSAKTLYPERFTDIDVQAIADAFYTKYLGHSFTALGGRLS